MLQESQADVRVWLCYETSKQADILVMECLFKMSPGLLMFVHATLWPRCHNNTEGCNAALFREPLIQWSQSCSWVVVSTPVISLWEPHGKKKKNHSGPTSIKWRSILLFPVRHGGVFTPQQCWIISWSIHLFPARQGDSLTKLAWQHSCRLVGSVTKRIWAFIASVIAKDTEWISSADNTPWCKWFPLCIICFSPSFFSPPKCGKVNIWVCFRTRDQYGSEWNGFMHTPIGLQHRGALHHIPSIVKNKECSLMLVAHKTLPVSFVNNHLCKLGVVFIVNWNNPVTCCSACVNSF